MKIKVGKAYEGGSQFRLEDGEYELQITDVQATKGRVNMTLTTSTGERIYKTFFLLDKDGKTQNARGMAELADYVTTAMQIEDMEVEVNVEQSLGCYLKCYVKNGEWKKDDGTVKKVYNTYSPQRCFGFSDGTASHVAEEQPEDAEEEVASEEEPMVDTEIDGNPDDILKQFGL